MFCSECGKMLPEGSFVCPNCGTVVSVTGAAAEVTAPETAAAGTTAAEMPAAVETPAAPVYTAEEVYTEETAQTLQYERGCRIR